MNLQIGITGGIGSGKTTVAKAFQALGYPVYYADDRAKALYDEDPGLKAAVKALVGDEAYDDQDKLIRKSLAAKIFTDDTLLAKINALVHPAVARDHAHWLNEARQQAASIVFKEAAILFEAGSHQQLDGVIMVYAPLQLRLERVMARDHATGAQVLARVQHQWPDAIKMLKSDFIIFNDGLHPITPQIAAAIQYFKS